MNDRSSNGLLRNSGRPGRAARAVAQPVRRAAAHPIATLALYLFAVLASIAAAAGLKIDADSSKMLNPDLPFQARALALREAFPDRKTAIVVAISADRADAADAVSAGLASLLAGRDGIAEVFAPATDPFFLTHGALWLETDALARRLSRLSGSANLIAGLRADPTPRGFVAALDRALASAEAAGKTADLTPVFDEAESVFRAALEGGGRAFGWNDAFSGAAGPVLRTVIVQPVLDHAALTPAKPALASIRRAIAGLEIPAGVEIGVTGDPALRHEELRSATVGIGRSLGLSLVFVALILWLALRTPGRILLGLGALATTLALTAGFAAVAVGALNLISIAFVVLMVGLGIDFAIHFMAHLDEQARESDAPLEAAVGDIATAAAHSAGPALLLTAASTSVAFLAFAVTDFTGMAQLGLIGGVGVPIAFLVAVTLIPAAVSLKPALALGAPRGRVPRALANGRAFPRIMAVLGLACAIPASESRFDADPMALRNPDAPSVRTYDLLAADPERSPLYASVAVDGARAAEDAAAKARGIDGVAKVSRLGSLIPDDQDAKLELIDLAWPSLEHAARGAPDPLAGGAPGRGAGDMSALAARLEHAGAGAGLAEALRAYEARRDSASDDRLRRDLFVWFPLFANRLAAMLDIERIEAETLPGPLARRFVSGGVHRIDIHPDSDIRDPVARAEFVAALAREFPNLTGGPAQIEAAKTAVSGAMLQAVALALLGAGLISFAALRSVSGASAILVPVVLAGAVCMAVGVAFDLPFNYANVIVLPLMIGIGVDTGVHLALRARRTRAVFATSTPMAAFYSALTTVAAFGTLALSDHRGTASMGVLLAVGLAATVAMTFALTPGIARCGVKRSS